MFTVKISEKGGAERQSVFEKAEVTIGRIQQNDVVLPKGNVSKHHSRIVLKDGRFLVVDLKSTNGTYVNGKRISTPTVVKPGDKIYIGDFILTVDQQADAQPETTEAPQHLADAGGSSQKDAPFAPPSIRPRTGSSSNVSVDAAPAKVPSAFSPPSFGPPPEPPSAAPSNISMPPPLPRRSSNSEQSVASESAANAFGLGKEPVEQVLTDPPEPIQSFRPAGRAPEKPPSTGSSANATGSFAHAGDSQQVVGLRRQHAAVPLHVGPGDHGALLAVMQQLEHRFNLHLASVDAMLDANRRAHAQTEVDTIISELSQSGAIGSDVNLDSVAQLAAREAVGLGCLEALLADDSVSEVCVNGPSDIRIDHGEGLKKSDLFVSSSRVLTTIARRLIAQTRNEDQSATTVLEGTLPYGPRVTVMLTPVAPRGPIIEIRRMGDAPTLEKLISANRITQEAADLLTRAVASKVNIAVVGELGSGVTTLLGALASEIPEDQRVVCVEDVADLQVTGPDIVSLTSGSGTLVDAIRHSAKLRADRIVVDDIRPADCESALLEIGARPSGSLIGLHVSPGDDPGEPIRRLAQGSEAAKHLVPQVAPLLVGIDARLGVTSVVESLKSKSTVLFIREGNALAKKADAKVC